MKLDEYRAELSAKGGELATWRQFTESLGWTWFKQTLESQRQMRLFMVGETPLKAFGETLAQEFMKGEGAGIGLSLALPYTLIESLELDIARLTTAIEMETDHDTKAAESAGSSSRVDDDRFASE